MEETIMSKSIEEALAFATGKTDVDLPVVTITTKPLVFDLDTQDAITYEFDGLFDHFTSDTCGDEEPTDVDFRRPDFSEI